MTCLVCSSGMTGPQHGCYYRCPSCGFQASTLEPQLDDAQAHATVDETARLEGLKDLRVGNFRLVLDALEPERPGARPALLDVGCGHGWFLEEAARRGYDVTGLEPDAAVLDLSGARAFPVIQGLFPRDLPPAKQFDVISFNDVFEHLPAPDAIAKACSDHLHPKGLLVISLPNSKGVLFRIARVLAKFGFTAPLDRLWQRNYPSPHLTYFHPDNLARLVERAGFKEVVRDRLPSVSLTGLWQRLRFDRQASLPSAAINWLALVVLSPVLRVLPSDNTFQVFRRQPAGDTAS